VYHHEQIRHYRPWPVSPNPRQLDFLNQGDPYADQQVDEMLMYRWEGRGQPLSNAGSLSSLGSYGHVDDLVLGKELEALGNDSLDQDYSSSGSGSETGSETGSYYNEEDTSSMFEAVEDLPVLYVKDSWV
jgi:hypothetical protein